MSQSFDVAVIGAGPSGIAAAISCAKNGASTVLIEKNSIIGGSALNAQVHTMKTRTNLSSEIFDNIVTKAWNQNIFQPEELLDRYYNLLEESKVKVLCDHEIISVDTEEDEIKSVMCSTEDSRKIVSAKIFIDASGQLLIEHLTGKNNFSGKRKCYMTAIIGKVETIGGRCYSQEAQKLLHDTIKKAKNNNELDDDLQIKISPTTRGDISLLEINCDDVNGDMGKIVHHKLQQAMSFLQKFGFGFENASIISAIKNINYTTDVIANTKYTLTYIDLASHKKFEDYIVSEVYFEDQPEKEKIDNTIPISIPIGTIESSIFTNLLYSGRNIGANSNVKVLLDGMAVHFATGKAAGVTASIAINRNIKLDEVSVFEVQAILEQKTEQVFDYEQEKNQKYNKDESLEFIKNNYEWEQQYSTPKKNSPVSTIVSKSNNDSSKSPFEVLDRAIDLIKKNDSTVQYKDKEDKTIQHEAMENTESIPVAPHIDKISNISKHFFDKTEDGKTSSPEDISSGFKIPDYIESKTSEKSDGLNTNNHLKEEIVPVKNGNREYKLYENIASQDFEKGELKEKRETEIKIPEQINSESSYNIPFSPLEQANKVEQEKSNASNISYNVFDYLEQVQKNGQILPNIAQGEYQTQKAIKNDEEKTDTIVGKSETIKDAPVVNNKFSSRVYDDIFGFDKNENEEKKGSIFDSHLPKVVQSDDVLNMMYSNDNHVENKISETKKKAEDTKIDIVYKVEQKTTANTTNQSKKTFQQNEDTIPESIRRLNEQTTEDASVAERIKKIEETVKNNTHTIPIFKKEEDIDPRKKILPSEYIGGFTQTISTQEDVESQPEISIESAKNYLERLKRSSENNIDRLRNYDDDKK